uniref:Methyltransferase domain-containing protein n=1 Tax=Lotharella oceanica TaxID=641309 RepID=A0A7S2TH62_9EUKA|mmetsp:Transcript_12069/g.23243  ORF Transcript_12069/g.23243 Transcript_12069/m.23243 type:complete len:245 (+) Transcript_12069:26-760(+)
MVSTSLVAGLAVIAGAMFLMRRNAAAVYDLFIVRMTTVWYRVVLERLRKDQRLLDIGIGTAAALCKNAKTLKDKGLRVSGIDYEKDYITAAERLVVQHNLQAQAEVYCRSVYDPGLASLLCPEGTEKFDAAYFSGSITLMPDPPKALEVAADLCKPGAKIYITQTFQLKHSPIAARVKPLLKYITTIDFGQLTYMQELDEIVKKAGMKIEENIPIAGSVQTQYQSARLVVVGSSAAGKADAKSD